jgi:Holliday junction DNA helicase RuvB
MELRPKAAAEIAMRARGVPRIANRLLRRVRDVSDSPKPKQVAKTLAELGIDSWGLDEGDRSILTLLFSRFDGGPVGVRTLASAAGHEERTLVEGFEPYLVRKGLLDVKERGRQLTVKGFLYCRQLTAGRGGGGTSNLMAYPIRR